MLVLGISYRERKNSPPPGLKWVKVQKDQTLGSIADEHGIRAIDLMLYNWHTVNGLEVNWYLRKFVGCRGDANKAGTYTFTGGENPGMILVPDVLADVANGPPKDVRAVRNGKATADTKLQVYVYEWLATGGAKPVSGKWVYVFSGSGGVDFGHKPKLPTFSSPRREIEIPRTPEEEPFSAFTLDFPGQFSIAEKADKLEYEIYVTGENEASTDFLDVVGAKKAPAPNYELGNNWFFLRDTAILKKATKDGRHTRTSHAYGGKGNNALVTIDLSKDRRYYFLLSPVQLGPEAIKYAMNNPDGLTPLLKPGLQKQQWDPANDTVDTQTLVGPTAADITEGRIKLRVIDPYAWAESLVEDVFAYSVATYVEWVTSKHDANLSELQADTGWTLEHFYLARIIKSVRDSHSKPGSIDSELKKGAATWDDDFKKWTDKLIERNATILANVGRDLHQILTWMDGPGHAIIETAIISDTKGDISQDALDIARGIEHWAVCTQYLFALEPGIAWLREKLFKPGNVAYAHLLGHLKDIEKDSFDWKPPPTLVKAYKYAHAGSLALVALQDFVSPKPGFPTLDRQAFLEELAKKRAKKRANLVKFLNASEILPAKVLIPPGTSLAEVDSFAPTWSAATASFVSMLDFGDKLTTYVIDPDIKIPRNKGGVGGKILNRLADWEVWFQNRPKQGVKVRAAFNYGLKGVALSVSSYNLYAMVTTARYDYQHSVSIVDWAGAIAGSTLAIQDVLSEVAGIAAKRFGPRFTTQLLPSLMTTSGGPTWGVGAASVTGVVGRVFAGANVLAMLVSGATTMYSMGTSAAKSYRNGDYAAAAAYGFGVAGGAMMMVGGAAFGYALMYAGGAVSATGIGATVGIVLFVVGGIIAGIAAFIGWWRTSDDYQIYARKCFLGDHSGKEPRWGDDPDDSPEWSLATTSSSNSWPIEMQRAGLMNLIGRFKVKTTPMKTYERNTPYSGDIKIKVAPGYLPEGSTIEFALHEGKSGKQTSATFEWKSFDADGKAARTEEPVKVEKNGIFSVDKMLCFFTVKKGQVTEILATAPAVTYFDRGEPLLATVTVRMGGEKNIIRCRKLIMEHGSVYGVRIDEDDVMSDIYK